MADNPTPYGPGEFLRNPDGTWSNEISTNTQDPDLMGGKPTVIPTLWKDAQGKPIHASEDEATEYAKRSGLQFPTFDTDEGAEKYANARESQWQGIEPGSPEHYAMGSLGTTSIDFGNLNPGPITRQINARLAGYDWGEIDAHLATLKNAAAQFGYNGREVDEGMGYNPGGLDLRLGNMMQTNKFLSNPDDHPLVQYTGGLIEPKE